MPDSPTPSESKSVATTDPFKSLSDRLDRVFGDFHFPGFGRSLFATPHFTSLTSTFDFKEPKVNVAETDSAFEITAELPGMDEKDVEVVVADRVLTIKGEKKEEKERKDESKNYQLVERNYGSFQRSFALPDNVKEDDVAAEFTKGVLTISLPKTKPSEPARAQKKIRIKSR
ncbi:MAG: Hsp20/alpha crystallin family protein [Alphaproteobacteria bacterium]